MNRSGDTSPRALPGLLGIWPISLLDTARTMLLVAILFAGPLFEHGIVDGGLKDWIRGRDVYQVLSSWIGYRNYVVVRISTPATGSYTDRRRAPSAKSSYGAL
jgi:prenyl protein peptidase